jgi:hypothetical protein
VKIDKKALTREETQVINAVIDRLWQAPDTETVLTNEEYIYKM